MTKERNFTHELAEYISKQDADEVNIVIEIFKSNIDNIPEKYRLIIWTALTRDIKDIPEYIKG